MVTLQLYNDITFNVVELEWILIWQNLQETAKYIRLTNLEQHYPYVPGKSEIEKERETKGKIREKISPPLDPATTSASGQGPPVVSVCQGA